MAFWTQNHSVNSSGIGTKDPKRKYRFKISINSLNDNGCVWWAKTVAKPSFEITESEHTFLTHKFYYPGRISWNEIEMTLVDPVSPGAVANLNAMIRAQGYAVPSEDLSGTSFETMSKGKGANALGAVLIQQLDAAGDVIETWELKNPFIKGVKYGDLDYTSDDLLEISLSLRYDWATCTIGSGDGVDSSNDSIGTNLVAGQPSDVRGGRSFFNAGDTASDGSSD
jgi:hypothetical protein